MTEKIRQFIQENAMIAPEDAVFAGVSGGADSVCLLLVLQMICRPGQVRAVHVNHQLRGEDADADERFVRQLCARHQIPLQICRYPVAELAAEKGIGTEEAGRLARQEAFRDCVKNQGPSVIALAHHANDRAETFLFHAARGTSLAGLAAIRPVQKMPDPAAIRPVQKMSDPASIRAVQPLTVSGGLTKIIRPLLCVTREEIEDWLKARGQEWRTDLTNADESYSRNALRHTVIPFLEKQINPQAVRHMAEVSADLEEADRFLREEASRRAEKYVRRKDREIRVGRAILQEPSLLQGYILMDALEDAGGSRKDLGREQVRQLQSLFEMQTGRQIHLPYGMCAERVYDEIRISVREENAQAKEEPAFITGAGCYTWRQWEFEVRVLENPREDGSGGNAQSLSAIPRKKYTKWLDYDKINDTLCIRSRQKGDRIVINAQGGSRKLKKYLIDEKVPREEREQIPLLASGDRVYWAVGFRIGEDAKVTQDTRRILEIRAKEPGSGEE